MYDHICKSCGVKIMQYRGSWFSSGDNARCRGDGEYHAPVPTPTAESTRESIAKFLDAEARKFEKAADDDFTRPDASIGRRERLTAKASVLTTMAAYIRRGDDKVVP